MSDSQIRVMLVDAHRIALSGLQQLVNGQKPEMAVVATATTSVAALELASSSSPDVIVLDVAFIEPTQPALVPTLINGSGRRVLILADPEGDRHEAAILSGAVGVVRKDDTPETLIKAIRKVHDGQLWLDRTTTGRLFVELCRQKGALAADPGEQKLASLTVREHEVVRTLVTQPGADNRTLADKLHIGEHTLRNHLSRIYDKLGVPNRLELYVFAQRHGMTGHAR